MVRATIALCVGLSILLAPAAAPAAGEQMSVSYGGDDTPYWERPRVWVALEAAVLGTTGGGFQDGVGDLSIMTYELPLPDARFVVTDLSGYDDGWGMWTVQGSGVGETGCIISVHAVGDAMTIEPVAGCGDMSRLEVFGSLRVRHRAAWRIQGEGTVQRDDGSTVSLALDLAAWSDRVYAEQTQGAGSGSLAVDDGTADVSLNIVCVSLGSTRDGLYDRYASILAAGSDGALYSIAVWNDRSNDGELYGWGPGDRVGIEEGADRSRAPHDCPVRFVRLHLLDDGRFIFRQV